VFIDNRCRLGYITNFDEDGAFFKCKSLSNITVEKQNPRFADVDGVLFDKLKNQILYYPEGKKDTHYTIPSGITAIEDYTFSNCESLVSITLPAGLTAIGYGAFSGCQNLRIIDIPAGVTVIKDHVFSNCGSLMSITLPAGLTAIGNGAFFVCENLAIINIPAGVAAVGEWAFSGCESLKEVYLSRKVMISEYAFANTPAKFIYTD
jgi:hypothetical protein